MRTAVVPMVANACQAAVGAAAEIGNIIVGRFAHALDLVPSSAGCRRELVVRKQNRFAVFRPVKGLYGA
jgi:hypothetical protein